MKTSRQKKARKHLAFFINNFKFRQPFQILIDGTFAFHALENKFNIQEQLPKYFQSEVKLLTTSCIILETEKLSTISKAVGGALQVVKQYSVHKCGHEKCPISGAKCIKFMVGKNNSSRYIIATQDRELQDTLRKIPGIPLLYLHGKAPTLEAPSAVSHSFANSVKKSLGMSTWEKENVETLKKAAGIQQESLVKQNRKKRNSGPNPLSCLKKRVKPRTENAQSMIGKNSGKVKKRKKVKIAAHVKEALVKAQTVNIDQ